MSEYIRKDKALDYLKYWKHLEAYDQIRDEQGIDIVRCKECKYDGTWKCPWRNTQVPRYPSADDFCSYGERSGDE